MELKTPSVAFLLRTFVAQSLLSSLASASRWTVTSYYAVTTSHYSTYTDDLFLETGTITIKPSATITGKPESTVVTTESYNDIKIVEIFYNPADINTKDIQPTTSYDFNADYTPTYWQQQFVYTAPSSCPTAFTVTTYSNVYIPTEVQDQLKPTSLTTSIFTDEDGDKHTYVTAFLSEGAVPTTTATTSDYIESYYINNCRNPTATGDDYWGPGTLHSGGDDSDDDDNISVCSLYTGCTSLRTWVIVVASVIPGLFVIGFFESFFWFRRLMHGKGALRFGTICWCLISLWVICFTRHTPPRNAADQPALRQKWNEMSMGTRFKLWFTWGFRHAYPVDLLGPDPRGITPSTGVPVGTGLPPGQGQPPMMPMQMQQQMQPPYPGQPVYYFNGPPPPDGKQPVFSGQPVYYYPGQPLPDGTQPPPPEGQPPYGQTYMMPQPYMAPQYNMPPPGTSPSPIASTTDAPTPPAAVYMQPQERTVSPGSDGLQVVPPPEQHQQGQQQAPPQPPAQQPTEQPPQHVPHNPPPQQ
ncbi:hypothetical protein BGZ63DRAFT_168522 [Mariannaea sp. PMI_226]|nr:hypothetical protein BGZ63DRAFT_168522 [Mariannaea sp. PMI_226]